MFSKISSQNSQENIFVRVYVLIKLQPETCNLLKKRLWHRYFPVNFAKSLRTLFLRNTSRRLLLNYIRNTYWQQSFRNTISQEKKSLYNMQSMNYESTWSANNVSLFIFLTFTVPLYYHLSKFDFIATNLIFSYVTVNMAILKPLATIRNQTI